MLKNITSSVNPEIKHFAVLNKSGRYRHEQNSFAIEGLRLCTDAMLSSVVIEKLYFTETARIKYGAELERLSDYALASCMVSDSVQSRLSETKNPQGVFGLCRMGGNALSKEIIIKNGGRYIALENVQDPSNIGAVARTAEALGLNGMIVSGGCDIYSPKALRASMGAFFRLPIMECSDMAELMQCLNEHGAKTFACVPDSSATDIRTADIGACTVAVVGNEGNGITDLLRQKCSAELTVPMAGRAESLNASHAATIVMWEMMR